MSSTDSDTTIAFTAPGRHELIGALCDRLAEVVDPDVSPEQGRTLVPWQATAETFEALPGRVIDVVLDEIAASGARLSSVEFSGYLETDEGPRAWGFLSLREGEGPAARIGHDPPEIVALESGYRITCLLRREGHGER